MLVIVLLDDKRLDYVLMDVGLDSSWGPKCPNSSMLCPTSVACVPEGYGCQ